MNTRLGLVLLLAAAGSFMVLSAYSAQPTILEIIPLQHRPASEIVPIIRPFVDKRGAVRGVKYQVILRTTPENLSTIREIIRRLDTLPRELLISFREAGNTGKSGSEQRLSGSMRTGTRGTVKAGDPGDNAGSDVLRPGESRLHIQARRDRGSDSVTGIQTVRTQEGRRVTIRAGSTVPIGQQVIKGYPAVAPASGATAYYEASTGLDAIARVHDGNVTVEIHSHAATPAAGDGRRFEVQESLATVHGRLGEWIEIGGITRAGRRLSSGLLSKEMQSRYRANRFYLKVELLHQP